MCRLQEEKVYPHHRITSEDFTLISCGNRGLLMYVGRVQREEGSGHPLQRTVTGNYKAPQSRRGHTWWFQHVPHNTCADDQHIGATQVIVAQGDALCHHLCPPLCLKSLCHQQQEEKSLSFLIFNLGNHIIVIKQLGSKRNCTFVASEDCKPKHIQIPFHHTMYHPFTRCKRKIHPLPSAN